MKKFNVWDRDNSRKGPTGPWAYLCTVTCMDSLYAIQSAADRFGVEFADLKAYDHIDNFEAVA